MKLSEARHLSKVQALGCIICRRNGYDTPAEVHHLTAGGRRLGHDHTIPLCPEHHRGKTGRHGMGRKAFEAAYGPESVMLLDVQILCD